MKKGSIKFTAFIIAAAMLLSLAACTKNGIDEATPKSDAGSVNNGGTGSNSGNSKTNTDPGNELTVTNVNIKDKLKDEDSDDSWDNATATLITLNGSAAIISGDGAKVSGGTVTITAAGTYVVSGTLAKGQILIDASKKDLVRLVLNGVNITADKNAAIYAAVAKKLVVILAPGTENTLTDVASYTYSDTEKEEPNAALFGKCDLSINGTGSLNVNGNFKHGINTKDDLVIADGFITVKSVNVALRGKDSVTILGGTFNLTSKSGDGIKSTNDADAEKGWVWIQGGDFTVNAYNDGIQAYTVLRIDDGTFDITAGGGWPGGSLKRGSHAANNNGVVKGTNPAAGSYKGIKSDKLLVINGGTVVISAYDDAVHCNGDIEINGGNLTLRSGDDGIHADETLTVNGGSIDIVWSYEGLEGKYIYITGGTIKVFATDDGINASLNGTGLISVSGGDIYVDSWGDGFDSNGNIEMTGGTIYIDGPTASQDGAIDYGDRNNYFNINGGTLVAVDCQQIESPSSTSTQPSVFIRFTSTQNAGQEISIHDSNGNTLIKYSPSEQYFNAIVSCPELKLNDTYYLYSGETQLCEVTLTSVVTGIYSNGSSYNQGGGMGGGQPGGGRQPGGRR